MNDREEIIRNYIEAYNAFDIDGMVRDFSEAIVFQNVSDDETTIVLNC